MSLWLLGGVDPTRGAGLHRDLVTARVRAPALRRCFAVTALTEQGRGEPARAWPVAASRLRARARRWPRPRAIKVGLVPDELVATVAELVSEAGVPVVVDPVLRASDGGRLGSSVEGLEPLLAVATLVTPNLDEARALVGKRVAQGGGEPLDEPQLAVALGRRWPAVLLKGGHGPDPEQVTDRLIEGSGVTAVTRRRIEGSDPRGTGCALATAIAAELALGASLRDAVGSAIAWLDEERTRWHAGPDGRAHLPDHGR